MNIYLKKLREQYEALRASVDGLQTRAAEENRALTEDEVRSRDAQIEEGKKLAAEIETLTEVETRNAKVAGLNATVTDDGGDGGEGGGHTRSTSTTTTRQRDPGHYTRSSEHGFFSDLFHARSLDDEEARTRLVEHNRALDMAGEGAGVVPPKWMTEEFQALARQQRKVANAVRNIPLSSAAPITMPKQTGDTEAAVRDQAAENDPTSFTDGYDTDVDTITPKATAGGQKVSRQMLDSGNPAVDALIFGDLVGVYNLRVEAKVVAAMTAAAGLPVATYATNAAWTTGLNPLHATYVLDAITDASLAVRIGRKLPADILVSSVGRYGSLLKIKDAGGRPIIPAASAGPSNVLGRGDVSIDGYLDTAALAVLATDGVPTTFPESLVVGRSADTILFESPMLRFRYEEPDGPETIRLGIWAYTATHVKYAGLSTKRIQVTAAGS